MPGLPFRLVSYLDQESTWDLPSCTPLDPQLSWSKVCWGSLRSPALKGHTHPKMGSKLAFKDCRSKVQVTCPLTPGTKESELDVEHSVDFLKVTSKRSGKRLAHVEQFTSPVAAEHTAYQVSEDGSSLTVTLTKQDPTRRWKTLEPEESEPEPAKQPAGPAAALAERDKVSQLLQAAQGGSLQDFQHAASAFSSELMWCWTLCIALLVSCFVPLTSFACRSRLGPSEGRQWQKLAALCCPAWADRPVQAPGGGSRVRCQCSG